jgi:hypothetical protein
VDKNGNGDIDFEEFCYFVKKSISNNKDNPLLIK